jgi:hypothetical protein
MHLRERHPSVEHRTGTESTVGGPMGHVELSLEEYLALHDAARRGRGGRPMRTPSVRKVKGSRKASAYSKRYGAAFKRLAKKNKKKNGGWKQGGFARTQKAAHKAAKK